MMLKTWRPLLKPEAKKKLKPMDELMGKLTHGLA
jgi:hypothetical protein